MEPDKITVLGWLHKICLKHWHGENDKSSAIVIYVSGSCPLCRALKDSDELSRSKFPDTTGS